MVKILVNEADALAGNLGAMQKLLTLLTAANIPDVIKGVAEARDLIAQGKQAKDDIAAAEKAGGDNAAWEKDLSDREDELKDEQGSHAVKVSAHKTNVEGYNDAMKQLGTDQKTVADKIVELDKELGAAKKAKRDFEAKTKEAAQEKDEATAQSQLYRKKIADFDKHINEA